MGSLIKSATHTCIHRKQGEVLTFELRLASILRRV